MSDCSKNSNPLVRNGTARHERFLPALDKKFVLPDERRFEDWIVYARNLAAHIKYHNPKNEVEGNWQPFFDTDISSLLALMAVQDIADYKDRIRTLFASIQGKKGSTDPETLRKDFGQLFGAVFSLAMRMDYFMGVLPDDVPLKRILFNLILTKLAPSLTRLSGYYKAAQEEYKSGTEPLLKQIADAKWSILGYPQEEAQQIGFASLSEKWHNSGNDWPDYFGQITPDKSIYNHPANDVPDTEVWNVLNRAVNHNLFSSVFAEFLSAYARIVREAQQQLIATISDQDTHEPHYALYLTFLHLLKYAQEDMNAYTGNHLDFYYKEILRLTPKKSEPNHVHLALELANASPDFLLAKGTTFKAGKDSLGREVLYQADEDTVLNKAVVTDLRSFYRAGASDIRGEGPDTFNGVLYASPIANSADGMGTKITTDSKAWAPFANKRFVDGSLDGIMMPQTRVGFAFASHYLLLKEGKRTVTLTLTGSDLSALNGKVFDVYLTTEKGWLYKTDLLPSVNGSTATFTIDVDAGDPPITAFVPKVHVDTFPGVDTPVIKFLLQNVPGSNAYDNLKDLTLDTVDITVNVGTLNGTFNTDGIRELTVFTDNGTADPSKPFIPFGQNPKKGAGMIIGNAEVFLKAGAQLKLFVEWAELADSTKSTDSYFFPGAQLQFLENGVWANSDFQSPATGVAGRMPNTGGVELFVDAQQGTLAQIDLPTDALTLPTEAVSDYRTTYAPFGINSRNGFLKVQLNEDFKWDEYYTALQTYYIKLANNTLSADAVPPTKPYLPKIQSMYLSYEATDTLFFHTSGNGARFVHLYPFGTEEIDPAAQNRLMPQFAHPEGAESAHHCAEFYIGLEQAVPPQKINLLFKVLDGSTDPQQAKPEKHIYWSYLSDNRWINFDRTELNDTTRQLIETGIITFSLPADATLNHTLLPAGKHWLRAAIQALPEEVCQLIDVRAQVIQATFYDQGNAEDFSQKPLAAGSISKLQNPAPAIKKTEQPYASFGGRYPETGPQFYTRVSERLRHKNRAITMRDVEQLVLERFPDIHKVKCLNHTRLELGNPFIYNELAPGHVTVITIPDLQNRNAINPLRPYTAKSRLQEIKQFLEAHANCHMTWHVENPDFEEIRIKTEIILTDDAAGNDTFYANRLRDDLVQFLTPWAQTLQTDIKFGGKIAQSTLINFMEERPYVDVILNLEMYHRREGEPESRSKDEISASTARSILVAAPAKKHEITITPKPAKN